LFAGWHDEFLLNDLRISTRLLVILTFYEKAHFFFGTLAPFFWPRRVQSRWPVCESSRVRPCRRFRFSLSRACAAASHFRQYCMRPYRICVCLSFSLAWYSSSAI